MQQKTVDKLPLKKTPRRSVLSDEIHEMIRAMIFSHEIAPGQRVNIDALAVRLEVSQTPIREALARLESEGLIAKEPLKGFSATPLLSLKEFDDLFQFRLLVEPWAAEQAAKKIDAVGIALKVELIRGRLNGWQDRRLLGISPAARGPGVGR